MKNFYIGLFGILILGGAIFWFSRGSGSVPATPMATNVSENGDKQIVEIVAKGGYSPRTTNAKAGMPTTIKLKTSGTFDCSAAFTIPSMRYRVFLPPTGETLVDIGTPKPGTSIKGVCAMGMYNFVVNFN